MIHELTPVRTDRSLGVRVFAIFLIFSAGIGFGAIFQHPSIIPSLNSGTLLSSRFPRSYWPTDEWRVSYPEASSMDSTLLNQMMAYIQTTEAAIDSVIIVRHGYIVFESYPSGEIQRTHQHMLQSVTKSVTSMLMGVAIHEGFIDNVSQRVIDFFPQRTIANLDWRKESMTLEHLLTMTGGLEWDEWTYPYTDTAHNNLAYLNLVSSDGVQYVLDRPMAAVPGTEWVYNSGGSVLLGAIIEEATGYDLMDFAREYLFDPLGIGGVHWIQFAGGYYHTGGGLFMKARDMARLGYLMLNHGSWGGQVIFSADWVKWATNATVQQWPGDPNHGYGYQWWVFPQLGVYYANGHYEQKIYVCPAYDLVVVFTANIADQDPHPTDFLLTEYILPAVTIYPFKVLITVLLFTPVVILTIIGFILLLRRQKLRRQAISKNK